MRPRRIVVPVLAAALIPTAAYGQLCPVPCPASGGQILCHHQNGILNHRGVQQTPVLGPNAAAGNAVGDGLWKIWGVENGMTRGSGVHTFTNWEIGADNTAAGGQGGGGLGTFDIPDLELRSVVVVGGVREPDLATPPIYTAAVGLINLPIGGFRINVSIVTPTTAIPASCPSIATLPTLSNADVAMLLLLTPGEAAGTPTYYENYGGNAEVNTISNGGNSYSGWTDGLLGAVGHMAINQEVFAGMGFYEPTLESNRQTAGFLFPEQGSGARELAAGDSMFLVSVDWESGARAIAGQDRLAAVVLSDNTVGNPLGLPPPGNPPGFLAGSLFLPGSTGVLGLYPTAMTGALLPFSTTLGAGLNCHVVNGLCSLGGAPSVFLDMQATTATIPIPPGLSGGVLYAAAFYVNLTTMTIDDGSNTVELLFL